jgi:hypothetical protein
MRSRGETESETDKDVVLKETLCTSQLYKERHRDRVRDREVGEHGTAKSSERINM